METVRAAYGRLIRAPIVGPFARLPMRLMRSLTRAPEQDPSSRLDVLSAQMLLARGDLDRLALDNDRLTQREAYLSLTVAMLSAMLATACDGAGMGADLTPSN